MCRNALEKRKTKMKKVIVFAAGLLLAAVTQGASVGWTLAGANNYAGDKYMFFVVGQNGADSIATISALLDAGESLDGYAFGSGTVAANGSAITTFGTSGKSLGEGTYESFYVIFDSASPTAGESKYALVSGGANQTKTFTATAASVTFAAGNQSSYLNDAANWKPYGSIPEPTSGLLMLVGLAGLALRRRRA